MLALAASIASLGNGFAYDDISIIANDWRIHRLDAPWQFFSRSYWAHVALYRPLSSLAFAVQWRLGGGAPLLYHLVNVLLYLLACLLVYGLAVRLLGKSPGWWAAALFAVHPVHVEAVGNSVGQSELWAAVCVLAAVTYYMSVRDRIRPLDIAVLAAFYGAGCLFKEHAVILPGLLLAVEGAMLTGRFRAVVQRRDLVFLYTALLLTAVVLLVVRASVTGSFAGERSAAALANLSLGDRLLTVLGVAPEWYRLLLIPVHLQADYMPLEIRVAHGLGPRQIVGGLLLFSTGIAGWRARHRLPTIAFAVSWVAITILPVSNLVVPTGILLAERTMFLPSVGAVLGAAVGIDWLIERLRRQWPRLRVLATGAGGVLLLAGTVRSAWRQPVWRDSETLFASLLVDAPDSYRTHWIHAHTLAAKGDRSGAERAYQKALGLFQDDPRLLAEMGDRYSATNRCGQAVALYRRSLAITRDTVFDRQGFNRCVASPTSLPP